MQPGPSTLHAGTRSALHVLAAHVLGRRRHEVTGRFGLRATPGGFGTPAFGDPLEVVRISGSALVHEVGTESAAVAISGSSLRRLAEFAGTDLDHPFSAGTDTPAVGDPDVPIELEDTTVAFLADWYALGWVVMDRVLDALADDAAPATIQLWPEHFDAGTSVGVPGGGRMNLGFSPGDALQSQPYAYVGPWGPERPGDPAYWNAPFGAVLAASDILAAKDPVARSVDFLRAGLHNLASGHGAFMGR